MLRRALVRTAQWLGSSGCSGETASCSGRAVLETCSSPLQRSWCAAGHRGHRALTSSSSSSSSSSSGGGGGIGTSRGFACLLHPHSAAAHQPSILEAYRQQPSLWGALQRRAPLHHAHHHHHHHHQQQQQQRGLFARAQVKPNYQDHNQKKPPKIKLKTPSAAKRRFIVDQDGVMWRRQANRGSKRAKKNHRQLRDLKAMVPVHSSLASKLRKMGYNRRWWFHNKA